MEGHIFFAWAASSSFDAIFLNNRRFKKRLAMSNYAKRYSKEFKQEAVRLLMTSGKSAHQLGKELGVTGMSLRCRE
jgi:transposase-like protein